MFVGRKKYFVAVILLLATMAANASPTLTSDNNTVIALLKTSDFPVIIASFTEPVGPEDKLVSIGREFLQPPASFAGLSHTQSNSSNPLPAVPETIFMVLFGFICISLVRDRRIWLAALTGILWAGQVGVQLLPQLVLQLSRINHSKRQPHTELTYSHYLENSNRLRSDIEGTQYVGLLHHLAGIPTTRNSYLNKDIQIYKSTFQSAAILAQTVLNPSLTCLAAETEQFTFFSPAFTFINLARGPPISV